MIVNTACSKDNTILKVGYDLQAPHRFSDKDGKAIGFDIERVKAIFNETSMKLEFYEYPWNRILRLIESGKLDVALAAGKLPERSKYAYFTDEIFKTGEINLFIVDQNKIDKQNFKELADLTKTELTVAVRRGASYSDEYELLKSNQTFQNKLVGIRTIEQAVRLANLGRVGGIITNQEILDWELQKSCSDISFYSAYDLSKKENSDSYIMLSKKTVSLQQVEEINKAMKKVDAANLVFNSQFTNLNLNCSNKNK